jgi:hypothetical protein
MANPDNDNPTKGEAISPGQHGHRYAEAAYAPSYPTWISILSSQSNDHRASEKSTPYTVAQFLYPIVSFLIEYLHHNPQEMIYHIVPQSAQWENFETLASHCHTLIWSIRCSNQLSFIQIVQYYSTFSPSNLSTHA